MNESTDTTMQWQMLRAEVLKSIDQERKDRQARMDAMNGYAVQWMDE